MRINGERIGVDAYTKSQKFGAKKIKNKTPPIEKIGFGLHVRARIYIYNPNTPHMCTSIFITYYSIKSAKTASFTKKYTWPRSKTSTPIQNDTVKCKKSVKKCC